tara:strand:- start:3057 stop:3287 length:231 start_codon:yes stop_codon:yes gene_type:complete
MSDQTHFDGTPEEVGERVYDLMTEVFEVYRELREREEDDVEKRILQGQVNAVEFARSWVKSGGTMDFEGNRACLPW